ncbi:MAG: sigma-54-dependent Fis family transcriptional regulator [Deltaproteobacteria bacterium]|nr:sigma-54-dependent Fis family transcriptional regulator [Deltaproteobacteria bacterium]
MRILLVDDERISRVTTGRQLGQVGYQVQTAESAEQALELFAQQPCDVIITDLRMPGMDGLELLARLRRERPDTDVIVMTAFGSVETAVRAMREGAADYLTKPFRFAELHERLNKIADMRGIRRELKHLRQQVLAGASDGDMVGQSPAMQQVRERLRLYADHDAPLLIQGETGTGKEVVSRALHALGPRHKQPFVAVACGAVPHELAESELFGHEKGSFTGAVRQRAGVFEQAHGGTLLLDDVDDLPLDIQVKLLRALQEQVITRVGGDHGFRVDVRLIATTKVPLRNAVAAGRFREDVFYRLRGLELRLPPLRERADDVLLLANSFLCQHSEAKGTPPLVLARATADLLRSYPWPGNVRELRRTMESASVLCAGDTILPEHLPDELRDGEAAGAQRFKLNLQGAEQLPFQAMVHDFEDRLIDWAMQRADGQQGKAAELLGLARTTLQSKLARRDGR